MRRRRLVVLAVANLLLVGATIAFWLWVLPREKTPAEQAEHSETYPGQAVRVRVIRPQPGGMERQVTRPGTVHSFQYAALFAKVSGFLSHQVVDLGDVVKKGQVLAEVHAPEFEADVRKAESDLKKAQANVEVARARLDEASANLVEAKAREEQAQADVESAQAMLTLRQQEHKRVKQLAGQGAVDQQLVDERFEARRAAEAKERSTEKAVATARAAIAAATANVTRAQADLDDSVAQVDVARAILDRAKTYLDYTRIRSPYAGVITQRGYHDGAYIRENGGNQSPLLTVARTDLMRVVVWVPDLYVSDLRLGDRAVVEVDALPGHSFTGVVARTASAEDPVSRTMRTEVDLPNPDNLLKEGMYGNVTIQMGKPRTAVTIPSEALAAGKGGQRWVYVVRDGRTHKVPVHVSADDGIHAEIHSSLSPHDEVVVRHAPGLADGVPVEVVTEGK